MMLWNWEQENFQMHSLLWQELIPLFQKKKKKAWKECIVRGILRNSKIDELLIMPINVENKLKIREKIFGKRVHSKCIIIMV